VNHQQAGHSIAFAAILVQAPRLVLTLLAADRQPVEPTWQRVLLVVAGIGTALVLTGGNLYLANTLATASRWRAQLAATWIAVLLSSGSLVVPLIAGGLGGRQLHEVLDSEPLQWSWAVLAAVAHEVTAAGCMLAAAARANESLGVSALPVPQPSRRRQSSLPQEVTPSSGSAAELAELRLAQLLPCREGCGRVFRSQLAEIGHLRHCPTRRLRLSGITTTKPS
jgi:hypothetical protein